MANGAKPLSADKGFAQYAPHPPYLNVVRACFTIGLTYREETATHGGKTKLSGTVGGKISSRPVAERFHTKRLMGKFIALMSLRRRVL